VNPNPLSVHCRAANCVVKVRRGVTLAGDSTDSSRKRLSLGLFECLTKLLREAVLAVTGQNVADGNDPCDRPFDDVESR